MEYSILAGRGDRGIVLFFDYTNGFHDAANIVATIIASRAMTPAQAVVVVGVFEFLGPLLGGTAVANTIGKFVDLSTVDAQPGGADPVLRPARRHRLESRDLVVRHSLIVVACAGRWSGRCGGRGRRLRVRDLGLVAADARRQAARRDEGAGVAVPLAAARFLGRFPDFPPRPEADGRRQADRQSDPAEAAVRHRGRPSRSRTAPTTRRRAWAC
jgi:hypothetical protein